MLGDIVHPPEQHSSDQVSSPLSGQILEFCESELFPETTLQNSEVASSSNNNCCYEEQSSYTTTLSFAPDVLKYSGQPPPMTTTTGPAKADTASTTAGPLTTTATTTTNFSLVFDNEEIPENDIANSIDFSTSPHFTLPTYSYNLNQDQDEQYDLSLLQTQISLADHNEYAIDSHEQNDHVVPIMPPPLPPVCEDDCSLSSMPPSKYMRLNPPSPPPNCSYIDPSMSSYLVGNMNSALSAENSGLFNTSLFLGNEIQHPEFEFQEDNGGIFCAEPSARGYNSSELQALSNESQHVLNGCGSSTTHLASDITSLEADTFRVTTKLTAEERREKIHRYMKKRNERNFSKKIKYACRKTLADSRPRVRGRFAKNDEFGEATRTTSITHEEDTDEDVKPFHVKVEQDYKAHTGYGIYSPYITQEQYNYSQGLSFLGCNQSDGPNFGLFLGRNY